MTATSNALPFADLPRKSTPALDLLSGTKVLDLTSSVAGPFAGQLLADLGATVVKVEKPGQGDDARAWGPPFLDGESLWFQSVNRGKQSVALDYGSPAGAALLLQLVARADVLLLNLVVSTQRKLGLDAPTLRARHPRLVHVSITGFGLDGERADLPCYDLIAEGYSGVMDLTGEPEGPPQKVGTPAADLLAGQDAAMAALAALLRRERDGSGCSIDVSMLQSMARFMAPRLVAYLGSGELARRSGGRDSVIAIYQVFETADEPMTLGLGNNAIWRRFWQAVGEPAMAEHPAYADNGARRTQRAAIVASIATLLKRKPRKHWLQLLQQARVPAGPIHRLDEVARDASLREAGFLYQTQAGARSVPQVGLGIRFDGRSEGGGRTAPMLGAHTAEVLDTWLGSN